MAKKVRTPAPPKRPVQVPQRRDAKKGRPATEGRNLVPVVAVLALLAAAGLAAALYFGLRHTKGSSSAATTGVTAAAKPNPYNSLPGIRRTKAPWPPEQTRLDDRLAPLNLTQNTTEQLAYHIHQHLDIFLNGKRIPIPQCIGLFGCYKRFVYITELHTHSVDGIIHVEAPAARHYTLGSFFGEWGVYLSTRCVGAYCQGYTWYVNGKKQSGAAYNLPLKAHLEIAIVIGKPPKKIPSTYRWQGL